jgi:glutathione S-transferase
LIRIYHRRGAGRPIRVVWTLEELGAPYELVIMTPEEAA